MKGEFPLSVIILEQDAGKVSRLEALCREAGFTVDALVAANIDTLRRALRERRWDMVLAVPGLPNQDARRIIAVVTEEGADTPVVFVTGEGNDVSAEELLRTGARDIAAIEHGEHLKHILKREVADLKDRRALAHYKTLLNTYEEQLLYFLGRADKRNGPGKTPTVTEQRQVAEPNASPAVTEQLQVAEPHAAPAVTEQRQVAEPNASPAVTEQRQVAKPNAAPAVTEQRQIAEPNAAPAVTEQRQIAEPNATPAVTEQRQVAESNPTPTVTEQLQVAGSNPTPAVTEQHRVEEPTLGPAGTEQLQVAASNPTPLVTEQPRVAQPRPVSAMKDQVQVEKPKSAPTGRTAPVPATPPPAAVSPVKQAPPPRAAGGNNRASFLDALTRVLTARPAKSAYRAVLYIELDKETLHAARWGDRATEQFMGDVEKRLRETLTAPYLVARHDAFVFVALINHRERQGLAKTAQGVKQAIEGGVFAVGGETVRVQCTMGVCFIDPRMRRAAGVIDHAKSACRKAREAGGRRIAFSGLSGTPSARAPQPENSDPEVVRLRKALAEDRFRLVFQPVVHFHAAPTETYEILLRMVDEKGWEIMPSEFIPKAEACGLMQEIDRWVVKTAVTALQERRQSGNDTRLFVKLSDVSIDSPDFLPWLQELLQIMPQQRDGLIFQFSEPMLAQRMDRALKFIHDLTALGCGTALDHFGMDKDSLSLAKKLPVNYLKIHGNLIQRLVQDISSQRLLKDIVDVAQTHGQVTIATFVQDPQILSILWRSRVDYVQGFYFQPPKPAMAYDFTSATS